MNKSLLIVICDFLILSIISMASFESPAIDEKRELESVKTKAFSDAQMLEMLKVSLDEEMARREKLNADVDKLAKAAKESKKQSESNRKILEAREKEMARLAKTKEALERERAEILKKSKALEEKVSASDKRNEALQTEILAASSRLEKSAEERLLLERQLGDMKSLDSASRVKLENAQRELKANKENLDRLRAEHEKILAENRVIDLEKQALSTQLEVATTKTQIYEENLLRTHLMVEMEKNEKERILDHAETLASNMTDLAGSHEKISQEVKNLRPKTPSEIFEEVRGKFLKISFSQTKKGLLGSTNSSNEIAVLPVKINGETWLVFSSEKSGLRPTLHTYFEPEKLSVKVSGKRESFEVDKIFCLKEDPRILAIPLDGEFAKKEIVESLESSKNTYAFPNCVVLNSDKMHYGQAPFRADFRSMGYAQIDVGLIQSIFGSFSPSGGDIVMSQAGEFLGVMIDSSLASVIRTLTIDRELSLGKKYSPTSCREFVLYNSARLKALPLGLR